MKRGVVLFFNIFYAIVLLGALYDLNLRISGFVRPSQVDTNSISILSIIMGYSLILILILSIISIALILIKKLPKYTLIFPCYFIVVAIWQILSTELIFNSMPYNEAIYLIDQLAKLDIIFYVIDLLLAVYMLYKLNPNWFKTNLTKYQ